MMLTLSQYSQMQILGPADVLWQFSSIHISYKVLLLEQPLLVQM